ARGGDVVAVAKIDTVKAGQWLGAGKLPPDVEIEYPARNCAIAIEPADRKDDVKLSGALHRLAEEDSALVVEHDEANHEIRLRGGDVVAVAKIDTVKAGQWLGAGKLPPDVEIEYPARNCAIAIEPADRKDDVKLSGALHRLAEEDSALVVEHDEANHEIRLRG